MDGKRGLFIAFEGIDGCGKSTQIKKFVNYLFNRDKHNHVVLTRNPYKDVNIRAMIRDGSDPMGEAEKFAELFVADRKLQSEEIVKPSLEKGHFIISDRHWLSTLTYQAAQGLDMQNLIEKHEGIVLPDVVFVIDVSSEEAHKRMALEGYRDEHRFEAHKDFQEAIRGKFSKAKELLKEHKIFIINGERMEEEIFDEIVGIFEREMREGS